MTAVTRADLEALDRTDPLAPFRDRFHLPEGVVYLDRNSLGALPKATPARVAEVIRAEWGEDLIRSWNKHGWIDLQQRIGDKIGRLIGARPGETLVADSTSVNVFKLLAAATGLRPERRVILSERSNFPTDLYMAEGLIALTGGRHTLRLEDWDDIEAAIDRETAVLMLTHVDYRRGRMWDMARLTARAHEAGALVLWDLAHSAGAVPVDLAGAGADFAVGCGYKYLNGGPGAPAFLMIAAPWQDRVTPPLTGWLGHARPFAFETSWAPAAGIRRAAVGTPPILSLAALEVGVDLMLEAPMAEVRAKSIRQADIFIDLVETRLACHGLTMVTPRRPEERGSQVSLAHESAWPIMQALIARGIIGDFRAPDLLRFGFTPLTLSYAELWDAVDGLREIMETRGWDRPEFHAVAAVT